MNKKKILFLILLLAFLILGVIIINNNYELSKKEWLESNEQIIETVLKLHPEDEKNIIKALENPKKTSEESILQKYGLSSVANLEYLDSFKDYQKKYYLSLGSFLFLFAILFCLYFHWIKKQEHEDIMKIDQYLFSLLSKEIHVNLQDFQTGELALLQNDLIKVTSKIKSSLDLSMKIKQELSKNLADISHQLKTPLTSLFLIQEALKANDLTPELRIDFLEKQAEILEHMNSLISSLLKLSQIESGVIPFKKEPIDLDKLILDVIKELNEMKNQKNITIQFSKNLEKPIIGDATWLKEAILNLIKNAIEHSKENGTIVIFTKETPIYTELQIKDFGIGILKEDLPHIFERFYKGKNEKGIGIGLNLTKNILDRMASTIRVKSKPQEGTTFIVHFYNKRI